MPSRKTSTSANCAPSAVSPTFHQRLAGGCKILALAALCLPLAATTAFAVDGLFPFVLPWDDNAPSITDQSSRLEKPAGAHGFVKVENGHLAINRSNRSDKKHRDGKAESKRIRFFGVNLCFGACFPSHADAEKIAARMAKLGIGCVRFHHMDTEAAPTGLVKADRRTLDPERLDRLDYFIAALKKNGIYADLNLHVGRVYPGTKIWEGMPGYCKGIDQFDPAMIESQKDYARQLLTHLNPYTGNRYVSEPAVAFVEINNENSLIDQWWNGKLDTMPDPYLGTLQERWNRWLSATYGGAKKWTALTEGLEPLGAELLLPKQGGSEWVLEQHGEAIAAVRPATVPATPGSGSKKGTAPQSAWNVQVERPGKENWHIQINQSGLKLLKGKPYTFTFKIRADAPRKLCVAVGQAHAPWQRLWTTQVEATTAWRECQLVFMPSEDDDNARIGFNDLGDKPGQFFFASPSLRPGSPGTSEETAPGRMTILRKSDFGAKSPRLQEAWVQFLWEQERSYWREMTRFLKDDLKVQSLLIGTQVNYSPSPIQAEMDVVDSHSYWQHPVFPREEWSLSDWSVRNIPMAGTEGGGALGVVAMGRVAGKPYICTEYSHPAPNTYSSESLPLLCAYGALQDWDAVFAFAYSHRLDDWNTRRFMSFFDIDQHPAKLAMLPASINLFCRGDVSAPSPGTSVAITQADAIARIRIGGPDLRADQFGLKREEMFHRPVSISLKTAGPANRKAPTAAAAVPEAKSPPGDHTELSWQGGDRGLVTINTPKTKGVIGYGIGRSFTLGEMILAPQAALQNWAAILVTETDGGSGENPKRPTKRFLVAATGYSENSKMGWKSPERTTVGTDWGKAPSLVEGVSATLTFPGHNDLRAWALDEYGRRGAEIPTVNGALEIGPAYKTLWYEAEYGQ